MNNSILQEYQNLKDTLSEEDYQNLVKRHGSPFDRGMADSYYRRGWNPHYFVGATNASTKVEFENMSDQEVELYTIGYDYNDYTGDHKEWD